MMILFISMNGISRAHLQHRAQNIVVIRPLKDIAFHLMIAVDGNYIPHRTPQSHLIHQVRKVRYLPTVIPLLKEMESPIMTTTAIPTQQGCIAIQNRLGDDHETNMMIATAIRTKDQHHTTVQDNPLFKTGGNRSKTHSDRTFPTAARKMKTSGLGNAG